MAALLVAGGVTAGVKLASSNSGPAGGSSSPQGAVQALFDAANNADVNAALADIDPLERADIGPGLQDVWSQLKRLGILSSSASLDSISGLNIDIPTANYQVTTLSSSVAEVMATSPQKVRESTDLEQLPVGPTLKQFIGPELSQNLPAQTSDFGKVTLGTVQVDGSWYVSLGYSIAINALAQNGSNPAPDPASQQPALAGADSPTDVVYNLIGGVQRSDLGEILGQFDPAEMGVAMAYSSRWLPQARSAFQQAMASIGPKLKASGFKITAYDLDLQTKQEDLGTVVTTGPNFNFSATLKGGSVSYSHGCLTETLSGQTKKTCSSGSGNQLLQYLPAPVQPILQRLEASQQGSGLVMVNDGGHWYLSLLRSYYQGAVNLLSSLQPGDFSTVAKNWPAIEQGLMKYFKSAESSFGGNFLAGMALPGLLAPGWESLVLGGAAVPQSGVTRAASGGVAAGLSAWAPLLQGTGFSQHLGHQTQG